MAIRDQKQLRSLLAVALAILAGTVVIRDFVIGESSQRTATVHVDSTPNRATAQRFSRNADGLVDLGPRLENLRLTEASTYDGTGRNIFRLEVEQSGEKIVYRQESIEPKSRAQVVPTSFPLKFFGFSRNGKTRLVFLLKGTDVFIAREGDIVDRRYRIVGIAQNSAQVEDLLSNQRRDLWFRETP